MNIIQSKTSHFIEKMFFEMPHYSYTHVVFNKIKTDQMGKITFLLLITLNSYLISYSQIKGDFTDTRDNKVYKTVVIGEQTWFAENLAFETKKGSWIYDKDDNNLKEYGRLYNWKTACNVCPSGWILPTIEDYKDLLQNLNVIDSLEYYNALIEDGSSSFDAKFAGWYAGRKYGQINEHTDFWTSSIYQPFKGASKNAYRFSVYKEKEMVYWNPEYSTYAFSVRCLKKNN